MFKFCRLDTSGMLDSPHVAKNVQKKRKPGRWRNLLSSSMSFSISWLQHWPSQNTPFPRWVQNGASVLMKQTGSHSGNKHVRISCSTASCTAKRIKARKGLCTIEDVSFSLLSKSVYHNGDDELQHLGSMKRKPGTGSNRNSGCMVMSSHVCQLPGLAKPKNNARTLGYDAIRAHHQQSHHPHHHHHHHQLHHH